MEESVNQLRFLASKPSGEEQGKLSDSADVDLDTGDSNDFEVTVAASEWNPETLLSIIYFHIILFHAAHLQSH